MLIAGVDEVGRGAIAGPMTAACVVLETGDRISVDDSKNMTAHQREHHFDYVKEKAYDWSIVHVNPREIDNNGWQESNKKILEKAVKELETTPDRIIVDGNIKLDLDIECRNVKKADSKYLVVGAASILAKVSRDRLMCIHREAHKYKWGSNKGYFTPEHKELLAKHGASTFHRKSCSPVREVLK